MVAHRPLTTIPEQLSWGGASIHLTTHSSALCGTDALRSWCTCGPVHVDQDSTSFYGIRQSPPTGTPTVIPSGSPAAPLLDKNFHTHWSNIAGPLEYEEPSGPDGLLSIFHSFCSFLTCLVWENITPSFSRRAHLYCFFSFSPSLLRDASIFSSSVYPDEFFQSPHSIDVQFLAITITISRNKLKQNGRSSKILRWLRGQQCRF